MSTQTIAVTLEERSVLGKGLQRLRHEGHVPAVIHNHGKESIHASGDFVALTKVYSEAGKHHPVQVKIAGKQHLALIKQVDFEPTKHRLRHIVFQAIRQNETTTAEIPIVLVGDEIPAEKKSLIVLKSLDTVEVEALPKDLPDEITVDATVLAEVGDKLTVADLKVPAGVTILTEPEHLIASVEMPKDQIAEANAAQAELAADAGTTGEAEEEATEETPAAAEAEEK
jgi:large subunit ribosomal protein L25